LLSALTSIYFLVNNLQRFEPAFYSLFLLIIIGIALFLKLFNANFIKRIKKLFIGITKYKYFTLLTMGIIVLLGISIRLSFYFKFSYLPVSDPATFYNAAQKIAKGLGMTGDNYIAFFPYLAAYDAILGFAMKIVSDPWLATIVLNTVFDIGASVVIYLLIKQLTKPDSRLPLIALGVWFLSPLNILFCIVSLPIIIVNFFIMTTIFIVHLLSRSLMANKLLLTLTLSLILGVVIGFGNWFRPIFPIAIIALFLLYIFILLKNGGTKKLLLSLGFSFLLVLAMFFCIQNFNISYVASQTGLDVTSSGAWSIYVGSNSVSDGTWNQLDEYRKKIICKDTSSNRDCQEKLQGAAIDRYRQQGIEGTLNLFVRKLYRFSSDQSVTYNANASIDSYAGSRIAKIMNIYTIAFIAVLFISSTIFLYLSAKRVMSRVEAVPVVIFASNLMLGFFLSIMLVETAPRYAQIMYPIFTLFAILALETTSSEPKDRLVTLSRPN
jgi:hypothetical protein